MIVPYFSSRQHLIELLLPGPCSPQPRQLATETLALRDPDRAFGDGDIVVFSSYLGEGYGMPTAAMLEAVRLVARSEG